VGEVGTIVAIGRERVGGLPREWINGHVKGVERFVPGPLPAECALSCDEFCGDGILKVRCEVLPLVVLRHDLAERTKDEAPIRFVDDDCGEVVGRQKREPIFSERRGRPHLTSGIGCASARVAHFKEGVPVAGCALGVDESHQPVNVAGSDQQVKVVVHVGVPQTSGQG
jgi:hypothetical protein